MALVVLICISLKDTEAVFMGFLPICTFSADRHLFKDFAVFVFILF